MPDCADLRAKAKAATPGPWDVGFAIEGTGYGYLCVTNEQDVDIVRGCGCCGSPYGDNHNDATYIAAASPDVVLNLLAERDCLREALERAERLLSVCEFDHPLDLMDLEKVNRVVAEFRERMADNA